RGRQRGPRRSLVRLRLLSSLLRLPSSLLRLLSSLLQLPSSLPRLLRLQALVGWLLTPRRNLMPPQRAAFLRFSAIGPAAWRYFATIRRASSRVRSFAAMSTLPPEADIAECGWNVRFVKADIWAQHANTRRMARA